MIRNNRKLFYQNICVYKCFCSVLWIMFLPYIVCLFIFVFWRWLSFCLSVLLLIEFHDKQISFTDSYELVGWNNCRQSFSSINPDMLLITWRRTLLFQLNFSMQKKSWMKQYSTLLPIIRYIIQIDFRQTTHFNI